MGIHNNLVVTDLLYTAMINDNVLTWQWWSFDFLVLAGVCSHGGCCAVIRSIKPHLASLRCPRVTWGVATSGDTTCRQYRIGTDKTFFCLLTALLTKQKYIFTGNVFTSISAPRYSIIDAIESLTELSEISTDAILLTSVILLWCNHGSIRTILYIYLLTQKYLFSMQFVLNITNY